MSSREHPSVLLLWDRSNVEHTSAEGWPVVAWIVAWLAPGRASLPVDPTWHNSTSTKTSTQNAGWAGLTDREKDWQQDNERTRCWLCATMDTFRWATWRTSLWEEKQQQQEYKKRWHWNPGAKATTQHRRVRSKSGNHQGPSHNIYQLSVETVTILRSEPLARK